MGEANSNTNKSQSISKQYKENSFESIWKRQTTYWKNRQRKNEQKTVGILLKKKIKSPINTWTTLIFTRIQGEEMQAKLIVRYCFTPPRLQTDKNPCLKTQNKTRTPIYCVWERKLVKSFQRNTEYIWRCVYPTIQKIHFQADTTEYTFTPLHGWRWQTCTRIECITLLCTANS